MKDQFYPSAYNFSEMAAVPRVSQRARTRKMKQHPGDFNDGSMEQKHVWQVVEDGFFAYPLRYQLFPRGPQAFSYVEPFRYRGGESETSIGGELPPPVSGWSPKGRSVVVNFEGHPNKNAAPGALFSRCAGRLRCKDCEWENLFEILYDKVNREFCKDLECCPPDKPVPKPQPPRCPPPPCPRPPCPPPPCPPQQTSLPIQSSLINAEEFFTKLNCFYEKLSRDFAQALGGSDEAETDEGEDQEECGQEQAEEQPPCASKGYGNFQPY